MQATRQSRPEVLMTGEPMKHSSLADAGSRRPLSRDLIITTAIDLADEAGVTALTMRRLAQQLGVEAMSLYRYVNGREDLLEGIVARLVEGVSTDPGERMAPSDGWQAYLQWFAHSVRDLALAHPLLFPLIATRHPSATWLRPPLRSVAIVEDFLMALIVRGLPETQAVAIYRSFTGFLLGYLLLETVTLGAAASPAEEPLDEGSANAPTRDQNIDLDRYPTVQRLQSKLSEDHTTAEFEQGLEALLDRMDLRLSQ
ncbi:MAG: TetR/AcrR family transcriptional regulator C-terminal domain-containing protein [Pseudonocardiales bacterium]